MKLAPKTYNYVPVRKRNLSISPLKNPYNLRHTIKPICINFETAVRKSDSSFGIKVSLRGTAFSMASLYLLKVLVLRYSVLH